MDRNTFRRIVLKSAFQKRKMYEALLEKVPLLSSLSVSVALKSPSVHGAFKVTFDVIISGLVL